MKRFNKNDFASYTARIEDTIMDLFDDIYAHHQEEVDKLNAEISRLKIMLACDLNKKEKNRGV